MPVAGAVQCIRLGHSEPLPETSALGGNPDVIDRNRISFFNVWFRGQSGRADHRLMDAGLLTIGPVYRVATDARGYEDLNSIKLHLPKRRKDWPKW
jgi:hypothetical protein